MPPKIPRTPQTANWYRVGSGLMEQLARPPSGKPGRKPRVYDHSLTPNITPSRRRRISTESPESGSGDSDTTIGPPTTPTQRSCGSSQMIGTASCSTYQPAFTIPSRNALPEPHLLNEEEIDQSAIHPDRFQRSLHNNLNGIGQPTTPDLWLHYNRRLDIHTPGLSYTTGFLYRKPIKPDDQELYDTKDVPLNNLPQFFDQLVSAL